MAITATNSVAQPASFSIGDGFRAQLMTYRALTGATSGTVTADGLKNVVAIMLDGQLKMTSAESFSGNVATLAFSVPAETAASASINGITYTAVANLGQDGNAITVQLVDGTGDTPAVTNGTETVFVTGNAIVVHIDPTAVTGSTRTNVRVAVNASAAAAALVTATGTSATVAAVTAATHLTSGVTGGARGSLVCLGHA
jgi:hypothetical protein